MTNHCTTEAFQARTTEHRTRSAHITDVSTTVLANDVRLQVWDGLQRNNDGDDLRVADVRLTVAQALSLIARLSAATDEAVAQADKPAFGQWR